MYRRLCSSDIGKRDCRVIYLQILGKKIVRFPREKLHKGDRKHTNKAKRILIQSLHQSAFCFAYSHVQFLRGHHEIFMIFKNLHHWNLKNDSVYWSVFEKSFPSSARPT